MYGLPRDLSHPDWINELGEIGVWFSYRFITS